MTARERRAAQKEKVEAGGAEELAVSVQPHVVGEQVAVGILFVRHRAELDKLEDFLVFTRARLREEGVAFHFDSTENSQDYQQRAEDDYGGQGAEEVNNTFQTISIHTRQSPFAYMIGDSRSSRE